VKLKPGVPQLSEAAKNAVIMEQKELENKLKMKE